MFANGIPNHSKYLQSSLAGLTTDYWINLGKEDFRTFDGCNVVFCIYQGLSVHFSKIFLRIRYNLGPLLQSIYALPLNFQLKFGSVCRLPYATNIIIFFALFANCQLLSAHIFVESTAHPLTLTRQSEYQSQSQSQYQFQSQSESQSRCKWCLLVENADDTGHR